MRRWLQRIGHPVTVPKTVVLRESDRLASEAAEAASERPAYNPNVSSYEGDYGGGSSSGDYTSKAAGSRNSDDGSLLTGDAQSWPNRWCADPWANKSGASSTWFENGMWTDHTK